MPMIRRLLAPLLAVLSLSLPAQAAQTSVAVAANFTDAAKDIAAAFKAATGDEAVLSFGASGPFYNQITNGAPFQIMLSADAARPAQLVKDGLGVAASRFTYAIGKLVLWSRTPGLATGEAALREGHFTKLSIAAPAGAPYGVAAIETLKSLGLYDTLQPRIVQGASIAHAFQFIDTGNAELGFVALSQLVGHDGGSRWIVPQALYTPITQDAVLLKSGEGNPAATGFMTFLKGQQARAIIARYGYDFAP